MTFNLSNSGNSNSVHYFDTSEKTFTYTASDGKEYTHCYYQIQFSFKGSGKGNWYLFVRQKANGKLVVDGSTKYLASGVYSGNCFNKSNGDVEAGALILKKTTDTWKNINIETNDTNSSFTLEVSSGKTLAEDAK